MTKEQWIAVGVSVVIIFIFFLGSMLFSGSAPSTGSDMDDVLTEEQPIEGLDVEEMVVDGGEVEGESATAEEVLLEMEQ